MSTLTKYLRDYASQDWELTKQRNPNIARTADALNPDYDSGRRKIILGAGAGVAAVGTMILLPGCSRLKDLAEKLHKKPVPRSELEEQIRSLAPEEFLQEFTPTLCSNAVTYNSFDGESGLDYFMLTPPEGTVYGGKTGKTYTIIDFCNDMFIKSSEVMTIAQNFVLINPPKIELPADKIKIKTDSYNRRLDIYSTIPLRGRTTKKDYGHHILWKPGEPLPVPRAFLDSGILEAVKGEVIRKLSL